MFEKAAGLGTLCFTLCRQLLLLRFIGGPKDISIDEGSLTSDVVWASVLLHAPAG